MRYFLDISYRGTAFHGWQVQPNAHTVQEELNNALSTLLQTPTVCVGSGRTDTGVHASQQIAHFDVEGVIQPDHLKYRMNSLLPKEISVNAILPVGAEAHARFDAERRTYHYYIHTQKNPFKSGLSYQFTVNMDLNSIAQALVRIKSCKNFQAFSKVHTDVNHFDCDIFAVDWQETNGGYLFSVSANRFLRGMVRAMVGTLLDIGQHRMTLEQFDEVLKSGDRSKAGRAVPPEGLFLAEVQYPKSVYLVN